MSDKHEAFRNAFSDEELDALFKDFPAEEEKKFRVREAGSLQSDWIHETVPIEEGKRFIFRNGLSRIDFERHGTFDMVKWDARIPDGLQPGLTANQFTGSFEPLLFDQLPRHAGLRWNFNQSTSINRYRSNSIAKIGHRGDQEKTYKLGLQNEYLQFLLDFCSSQYSFDTLAITAKSYSSTQPDYMLRVNYGERDAAAGSIVLLLPAHMRKYNPWNPQMTRFIMYHHVDREQLETNPKSPADLAAYINTTLLQSDQ